MKLIDPFRMNEVLWPHMRIYDKQREIIKSVEENVETFVVAGNKLGKDYIAARIVVNSFLRCLKAGVTCRIVTTSVAEHHLYVLWGEIGRAIMEAEVPLLSKVGGPLILQHMEIRRAKEKEARNPLNYAVGRVSAKGEGLAGHHADWTLFVGDEASGLDNVAYEMAQGWARRMLIFSNPNPCQNFYFQGVEGGDISAVTA